MNLMNEINQIIYIYNIYIDCGHSLKLDLTGKHGYLGCIANYDNPYDSSTIHLGVSWSDSLGMTALKTEPRCRRKTPQIERFFLLC